MSMIATLAQASKNLLMMSESDNPFEPLEWQMQPNRRLEEDLLQHFNYPENTQVETVSIDDFFRQACTEQEWHTQTEKETAKKFQSLVETLKRELSQLQVFRLHKTSTNIEVYILGQTTNGEVAGLKTELVET
jgi:Nuclease A inhibitor-like protein